MKGAPPPSGSPAGTASEQSGAQAAPQVAVVVIGAGIGGLASAIRLACAGYRVDVFEAAAEPGGKVAEHRDGPYRFDMGPSLFTLPEVLDELFRDAGAEPRDYYRYKRLDPICRYFFPSGKVLNAWADPARMAAEFEVVLGEPAANVQRYLKRARRIYELTENIFLRASLHDWRTYWRAPWLRTLAGLPSLDAMRSMHKSNSSLFEQPESVQLFDRYATYNGSNPYRAPATLNVIGHLEHNLGAWFPEGGMRSLVRALHRLALERGVRFHFGCRVEEILVEGRQVRGVRVRRETESGPEAGHSSTSNQHAPTWEQPAEAVVSNMDVVPTYRRLLPGQPEPRRILDQPRSTSALIFYWGMDRRFPQLDLHNILFSADYPGEFRHLSQTKTLSEDPTVYLYLSCRSEPGDAPPDGENWFAMINAPHSAGQDWDALCELARSRILAKAEAVLGEPVAPHICTEYRLDPRDIEARTSSFLGALYGNSSDNPMAAFLRHPNFSRQIAGLYFCGGSVHPGGGIPLCLLSARITAEHLQRRNPPAST